MVEDLRLRGVIVDERLQHVVGSEAANGSEEKRGGNACLGSGIQYGQEEEAMQKESSNIV